MLSDEPIRAWTRTRHSFLFLACTAMTLAIGGAGAVAAPSARAGESDVEKPKKSVDPDAVYVGDARADWTKPAEVDADAVFAQIDEYKEIVDKKLDTTDPKYGVLMCKARKKFLAALRAVAKDSGYDLVARVGTVKGVESIPVITQDAIAKL